MEIVGTLPRTWEWQQTWAGIIRIKQNLCKPSTDLHLDALAVDEFSRRHERIKHKGTLLARIHHDAVDFALDLQGRTFAAEHVHHVVHLGILHHKVGVVFLILDQPFLAVAREGRRFSDSCCGGWGYRFCTVGNTGRCLVRCRTRAEGRVFVRLHVGRYLLQACKRKMNKYHMVERIQTHWNNGAQQTQKVPCVVVFLFTLRNISTLIDLSKQSAPIVSRAVRRQIA